MSQHYEIVKELSENPTMSYDFMFMVMGGFLGRGASRRVLNNDLDSNMVIKVETGSNSFRNVREWEIWNESDYQLPHIRKWLAPCYHISPSGTFLVQAKTIPCTEVDLKKMPKKVPAILANDIKLGNWGWYKGKIVCHDYGHARLFAGHRLEKVKWD